MTWLQILAQAGIIATFLGIGVAIAAYFNGKHIKEGVRETRRVIENLGTMIENLGTMIENSSRETREILERMDQRAEERHGELIKMLEPKRA